MLAPEAGPRVALAAALVLSAAAPLVLAVTGRVRLSLAELARKVARLESLDLGPDRAALVCSECGPLADVV